jgi:hypothetical protein
LKSGSNKNAKLALFNKPKNSLPLNKLALQAIFIAMLTGALVQA